MAISAQELNIILTARDKQFAKAMADNQKRVERFSKNSQKNLSNTSKSFALLGSAAKRFLPALAVGAVVSAVKKVTSSMDEIGKRADAIGIGTNALQELRAAAVSAGVSQNGLDKSLEQFSKRLGEAVQGTGTAKDALEQMGLSAEDLAQMPLDKALGVFADKFALVEDATTRTALATQVFGREGIRMTNLLKGGSAALDESRKKMREMGVVIDEDLIRNAEEMQDRFDAASTVIGAQFSVILGNLAPILIAAAEGAASLAKAVADLIRFVDSFTDGQDAVDDAVRAVVVSMAGEINQSKLLEAQLARGGKMSVDTAKKKHEEALARLEAAKAAMAEAKADRLNSDAYKDLTARIARRQAMLTESPEEAADRARRLRAADPSGRGDGTAAAAAQLASAKLQLIELNRQRDALLDSSGFQDLNEQITRASANVEKLAAALAKAKNGNISLGPSITPIALDPKGAAKAAEERKATLQAYEDAVAEFDDAVAQMTADQVDRLRDVQAAYDSVRGSIDPLYAAYQQTAQAIVAVNDALAEGIITEQQASADREQLIEQLKQTQDELSGTKDLMNSLEQSISTAFGEFITGSASAGDAFKRLAATIIQELIRIEIQNAKLGKASLIGSLFSGLGGLLGLGGGGHGGATALASGVPAAQSLGVLGFAKGGVFSGGNIMPFASGGVVKGPTLFPMAKGAGLMGEAGPEAIMPLKRGPDGKLGVAGGGANVNVNIINQAGAEVDTRQNGPDIDVIIRKAVASDIAGGGQIYRAIGQRFETSTRLTRR